MYEKDHKLANNVLALAHFKRYEVALRFIQEKQPIPLKINKMMGEGITRISSGILLLDVCFCNNMIKQQKSFHIQSILKL